MKTVINPPRVRVAGSRARTPSRPGAAPSKTLPSYGLIVAAGQGQRFGGYKQLAQLAGKPVLIHSARAFERCPQIIGFVVVVPALRLAMVRRMLRIHNIRKLLGVVLGGETRAGSVRAGLSVLPAQGLVAVHDAVRPLINASMLTNGLRTCKSRGAVTYGYPVTDTLKRVSGRNVLSTVDRSGLLAVQTPQFFNLELLRRAHAEARRARIQATDDCELIERLGIHPIWIPGPHTNLKVTTPDDLNVMQALL
jgi:2-C-methyl-D-erythritol 4-phosphate cytidylyltransferase